MLEVVMATQRTREAALVGERPASKRLTAICEAEFVAPGLLC